MKTIRITTLLFFLVSLSQAISNVYAGGQQKPKPPKNSSVGVISDQAGENTDTNEKCPSPCQKNEHDNYGGCPTKREWYCECPNGKGSHHMDCIRN